ncbi:phage antirepressor [Weissella koreensis]|uniref:phage antirepressor n=1 Tax=Weissella koreensis TaxID=165096 RepID=UPI000CF361C0|nr:phage antirepressor [Weissella koreensis]AVH74743.1 hypothetical protein C4597_01340 [Weissella koreensis]QGN19967.1 hypothetical protein GKC51_01320 [Weissella koreensis]
MKEVQVFNFEQSNVRTMMIDNEPYFVGKDIAEVLGYSNPQKAIRDHIDNDDKTVNESFTVNGTKIILINESGVYSLIFGSKLDSAKRFKKWVTSEVLPSIRKTGGYQMQPQFNVPQTLSEALRLSADLAEQNAELKPKAELHDKFIATAGAINLTAASKELNVKRNDLVDKLLNYGYIYRTKGHRGILQPMKKYVPKLFVLKSGGYNSNGIEFTPQMLITPYGREVIYKKFYAPDQTELDMEDM